MPKKSKHEIISYQELCHIPSPDSTPTYFAIPHHKIYTSALTFAQQAGLIFLKDDIKITKNGQRAYIKLIFKYKEEDSYVYTVGIRSTYDKSASIAIAAGAGVEVCDNQIIYGEDIIWLRKHTKNVANDIDILIQKALEVGKDNYYERIDWLEKKKDIPLSHSQGVAILGAIKSLGIINDNCYQIALSHWKEPPFDTFKNELNVYGLHNALTWGLEFVRPLEKLEMHAAMNQFINGVYISTRGELVLSCIE